MILLDTHIWLWWIDAPNKIGENLQDRLHAEELAISSISFWEISMLSEKGRISLDEPSSRWIRNAMANYQTQVIELAPEVAQLSASLPGNFHRDPADQIIVATAISHNFELATMDRKILDYPHVRTIR